MNRSGWRVALAASLAAACHTHRIVAPLRPGPTRLAAEAPFRSVPPPLRPTVELVDEPPVQATLPNGLRIVVVRRPGALFLEARLLVDRSSVDTEDGGGVAVSQMLHFFGGDVAIGAGAAASVASPTPGSRWWLGRTGDTVVALAKAPTSLLDESLAHLAQDVVSARLAPAEHARRAREWAQVAALKPFSMDMGVERVLFGRAHPYGSTGLRGSFLSVEAAQGLHGVPAIAWTV